MSEDGIGIRRRHEASDWMIALQERPDDAALRRRFETWRQDPSSAGAWRDLDHVSTLIRQAGPMAPGIGGPPTDRRRRRSGWRVAVPMGLAACGAALLVADALRSPIGADLATGTGEKKTVRLADGSRVTLAPHSAIGIEGGTAGRHVRLLRGRAFFDVVHDDARPFRVTAGHAIATDLGTAFEMRRDGDATAIAVRDGLVRASCDDGRGDPALLRPGETAELDCSAGRGRRSRVVPATVAAWTRGQLVIVDRPLREVVAALRPWQHGLLLIRGGGTERRVTGVYDLRHPDRALAALGRAHGVTIMKISPWIRVVSAD